jgi:hypothetical protein
MQNSKRIAVARYRQVLEDGPDAWNSESDAEYSDRGEVLEGMHTADMLDPEGKPVLDGARMPME